MTSEVATSLWANNMDLFALTTFDNLVELYRISFKAQKVFQTQEDKGIKGLAFSPDCSILNIQHNFWHTALMMVLLRSSKQKMDKKFYHWTVRIH